MPAAASNHFQTKALPGDGVYSMLRRYHLEGYRCNFDEFYRLNKINANSGLRVGKSYFLPILQVPFDGKTIRSSTGNSDWDTAVKIRDYNRSLQELGLVDGSYEQTQVLLVPHHIRHCPSEAIVVASPVKTDPEQASSAPQTNSNLASDNAADAGGGGAYFQFLARLCLYSLGQYAVKRESFLYRQWAWRPDPGAIGQRGNYQLCEDEYAYDVALRLCRNLIAHGATAYMVNRDPDDGIRNDKFLKCDTDEVIWGDIRQSANQKVRLTQRSDVINELYEKHRLQGVTEQKVVVIHVDSRSQSQRTDLFFYHHPSSQEGQELARVMHRTMKAKYRQYRANGEYHGTVTARDLHMLRECKPTSVYVELANIRNTHDQQRIILERNRELLADWMLEGLISSGQQ
ncbi:MAG: N-acetylmuramoyl-L-alanine amidase [Saprospiraceae bacterium]